MRILQHGFRVYVGTDRLAAAIHFYETLQGVACERKIQIAETGILAAKVGAFLILSGDAARLEPVRHVDALFYVDALDEFAAWLVSQDVEIVHPLRTVTAGRNLTARHPDGLVGEYFEAARGEERK